MMHRSMQLSEKNGKYQRNHTCICLQRSVIDGEILFTCLKKKKTANFRRNRCICIKELQRSGASHKLQHPSCNFPTIHPSLYSITEMFAQLGLQILVKF